MEINLEGLGLNAHNKFELQLLDKEGNIKQEAFAYNVADSSRLVMMGLCRKWPGSNSTHSINSPLHGMHLGKGTGTPLISDAQLFTQAFASGTLTWVRDTAYNFSRMTYHTSYSFPANTSYVAALTEIGLGSGSTSLLTHALLVDSEGNPITVTKTANDILVVTAYVYFTIMRPIQNELGLRYFPALASAITGSGDFGTYPGYYLTGSTMRVPLPACEKFGFSTQRLCEAVAGILPTNAMPLLFTYGTTTAAATISDGLPVYPITLSATNMRKNQTEFNFGFAHHIQIHGLGAIPLPNENIIPPYAYTGISLGTGDGNTNTFYTEVNEVVSATGYVDGVEASSTFVNFDITKTPLWNKCIRLEAVDNSGVLIGDILYPGAYADEEAINAAPIACTLQNAATKCITPCKYGYATPGYRVVYSDAAGITLDHIRTGYYQNKSTWYRLDITLEYSDDDETWTTAVTHTTGHITEYFTPVTAKYWRMSGGRPRYPTTNEPLNYAISTRNEATSASQSHVYDQCDIVVGNSAVHDFGKVGITFDAAPAEGTVLTMDAVLNLPYKSLDTVSLASIVMTIADPMA